MAMERTGSPAASQIHSSLTIRMGKPCCTPMQERFRTMGQLPLAQQVIISTLDLYPQGVYLDDYRIQRRILVIPTPLTVHTTAQARAFLMEGPGRGQSRNLLEEIIMCGTSSHNLPLIQASAGCACCSPRGNNAAEPAVAVDAADTRHRSTQFKVAGMTCGHCVAGVSEKLGRLEGIADVAVDLVSNGDSTVTVYGTENISLVALRAAVSEAGYEFAGTV
ncbi:heavy-metal-associated domain-containing protein [Arthrobacter crystallopoietes]|uniref:heavy-metal-associated domain-containing protein n=1 Tax=Crystallibacter crystallopoietes TaxID=37928 RepID=UPI003298BD6B